jgi:protein-tyrosine phosphatase
MATRVYWIERFSNGARLGIMARPRSDEWLPDEIERLKKQNVLVLVSLLETSEITELGLGKEAEVCAQCGIEFLHFPIPDRSVPSSEKLVSAFIKVLWEKLEAGASVVVHCRMGIGRSSLIAGAVLLLKGYSTNQIIERITVARGLKVPDTHDQIAWLRKREKTGPRA